MKLKELNTTLENQRTICYKKDGNSITYHNKDMRLVEGCLFSKLEKQQQIQHKLLGGNKNDTF